MQIVDEQLEDDPLGHLRALAADTLAMGITAMSEYQLQGALAAAEAMRSVNPGLPLIWGGWHASLLPEQTARDPLVDVVVRGPGEHTLRELLERIAAGKGWEGVPGTTYRRGDEIVSEADRPFTGIDPDRQLPCCAGHGSARLGSRYIPSVPDDTKKTARPLGACGLFHKQELGNRYIPAASWTSAPWSR